MTSKSQARGAPAGRESSKTPRDYKRNRWSRDRTRSLRRVLDEVIAIDARLADESLPAYERTAPLAARITLLWVARSGMASGFKPRFVGQRAAYPPKEVA